ncbi:unnamed protein product [Owenia fusiformis]|uniref:Uncharacterized protein n=1 Tax=Owenia fusiformis TaxID=6347 RepID=A0A8J1XFH1_OWEFU|nr:unnamed protein product [Owenia fusiformis]
MKLYILVTLVVNICLAVCTPVITDTSLNNDTKTTLDNETVPLSPIDQPESQASDSAYRLYTRGPCPYGFIYNANQRTCYSLNTNNQGVTWFEALSFCMSMHANLVAIESEQEQLYILGMLRHFEHGDSTVWTGGNTLSKHGNWFWAGGLHAPQKRFTYTRWAPGEPSNHDNHNNWEKCVYLESKKEHKWNDDSCYRKLYFICERGVK